LILRSPQARFRLCRNESTSSGAAWHSSSIRPASWPCIRELSMPWDINKLGQWLLNIRRLRRLRESNVVFWFSHLAKTTSFSQSHRQCTCAVRSTDVSYHAANDSARCARCSFRCL
jgi:hypothetical protein